MKKKKSKCKTVRINLPLRRIKELEDIAKLSGTTIDETVNVLLAKYLVENQLEDKLHKPKP
jgi:hypothetical protein